MFWVAAVRRSVTGEAMSREQQRQNARDQKRIEQRKKARQASARPAQPQLKKRPGAAQPAARSYATVPQRRSRLPLPRWWPWAAAVAALAIIVALFFLFDPLGLFTPLPGKKMPSQGNAHVQPGQARVVYNTNPPTSGPHFDKPPQRGRYTTPFVTEYLPHFLEHAGVEVSYNPSSASQDVIDALTKIVDKELDGVFGRVLLSPVPNMPCQVALTSWQRIQTFGTLPDCQLGSVGHDFSPKSGKDSDIVKTFIERNQCAYDPEGICGSKHGELNTAATPRPGEPTVIASLGAATPGAGSPVTPAPAPLVPGATPAP